MADRGGRRIMSELQDIIRINEQIEALPGVDEFTAHAARRVVKLAKDLHSLLMNSFCMCEISQGTDEDDYVIHHPECPKFLVQQRWLNDQRA